MPNYLAPGVYVEEVDAGTKPIEGVSTSITGFVGATQRGPNSGAPVLVTSFLDFQRNFGGYFDFGSTWSGFNYLPFAVEGFFQNGGQLLYITRVTKTGANAPTTTSTTAHGGLITRLRRDTSTAAGADNIIFPATLRGLQAGTKIVLQMVKNGVTTLSPTGGGTLTVTTIDPATGKVTLSGPLTTIFEAAYTTVFTDINKLDTATGTLTPPLADPRTGQDPSFTLAATSPGSWGNQLIIEPVHESAARSAVINVLTHAAGSNTVQVASGAGFYQGAWVEIDQGLHKHYRQIKTVTGQVLELDGPDVTAPDIVTADGGFSATVISTCEFRLTITYQDPTGPGGPIVEQFGGLTLDNIPGRYYKDILNNGSKLITITADPPDTHPFLFPSGSDGRRIRIDTPGADGDPPAALDVKGVDNGPGRRTGVKALEDIERISIIAAPGRTDQVVQDALIEQCERLRYRFAILDPAPKAGNQAPDLNDIQNQRDLYDTKYAALYYPRVCMPDPSGVMVPVPPSGHMAGIYARVDEERGVHKAPANEVIADITGLEQIINKAEQDVLNPEPNNINVLRDFRREGRGLRVWGARCITSDTAWKYINIRRLFIFLEASLDVGTQWVVFEPNDYRLWARVTQSISDFLTRVWRNGALMGRTAEEAFFVKCDRTTMTQDDIDNGRLIVIIGVAPVYPAEYVIIRIGQWAGGSAAQEL